MPVLRASLRLISMVLVTPPLYLGWVITRPVGWLLPRTNPVLQRVFIGTWARAVLGIMGVRARFVGPKPTGPFFLVANHLSYIDIPVLLARLDARFLAKSEVAGWPVMGFLARSTGTLFIDRTRKRDLTRAMQEIHAVLASDTGVIVFPEGTSTDGATVQAFKPSLFEVPLEAGLVVHCASIQYGAPDGPLPAWQAVCWWGDAPFGGHFWQFLKQKRTFATVTFSPETASAPDISGPGRRKALAQASQDIVERVFTPSRSPESEACPSQGPETSDGTSAAPPQGSPKSGDGRTAIEDTATTSL